MGLYLLLQLVSLFIQSQFTAFMMEKNMKCIFVIHMVSFQEMYNHHNTCECTNKVWDMAHQTNQRKHQNEIKVNDLFLP